MTTRSLDPIANLETAPLLRRFGALIIDGFLLLLLGLIVAAILQEPYLDEGRSLSAIFVIAIAGILEHVFLMRYGGTPGKLVLGIYVGTTTGARVTHAQAIFRDLVFAVFFVDYLLPSAGLVTGVLFLISVVMMISDRQHRALHDRLAGTRVLIGPPPEEPMPNGVFPRL